MKTFMCACLLLAASAVHAEELVIEQDVKIDGGIRALEIRTFIVTDTQTGCQYIQTTYKEAGYAGGIAMVPRMDRYGNQVCSK